MSANATGSLKMTALGASDGDVLTRTGNITVTKGTNNTFGQGAGKNNAIYGNQINIDVSHTHNYSHTHGISDSGGSESKPINLTAKLWKRIS